MEFTVPRARAIRGRKEPQQGDPLHEQCDLHLPHETKSTIMDVSLEGVPGEQSGRDRCQQCWQFNAILCLLTNSCHLRGQLEDPRLAVDTRGTARIAPPGEVLAEHTHRLHHVALRWKR